MSKSAQGRPGLPVEPNRLFRTLWRRRRVFILTLLGFLAFGYVYVKVFMGYAWATDVLLQYEGDIAVGEIKPPSRFTLAPASEALKRRSVLEEIRKRYESKDHFFETALDLDEAKLEELKNRYLH